MKLLKILTGQIENTMKHLSKIIFAEDIAPGKPILVSEPWCYPEATKRFDGVYCESSVSNSKYFFKYYLPDLGRKALKRILEIFSN